MNFNSIESLKEAGFVGFKRIGDLFESCSDIPEEEGVYLVLYPDRNTPEFINPGVGGFHNGRDPNVEISELKSNWVDKTVVLYIGHTKSSLNKRISTYMRFGRGLAAPHHGGRYIWQIQNYQDLLLAWKVCPNGSPHPTELESQMIYEFKSNYGVLPFANLKTTRDQKRILGIKIKGLFGQFDHEIRLFLDDRITIIMAPNGYGKTTILQLINGLFSHDWGKLRKTPFDSLQIEFDDNSVLEVLKPDHSVNQEKQCFTASSFDFSSETMIFAYYRRGMNDAESPPEDYIESEISAELRRKIYAKVDVKFENLVLIDCDLWLDTSTGENVDLEEILEILGQEGFNPTDLYSDVEPWLRNLLELVSVKFIDIQRLTQYRDKALIDSEDERDPRSRRRRGVAIVPTVKTYSDRLNKLRKKTIDDWRKRSADLKATFPMRIAEIFEHKSKVDNSMQWKNNTRFKKHEEYCRHLVEAGLLPDDFRIQPLPFQEATRNEHTAILISLQLKDIEEEINIIRELDEKISLFTEIINDQFLGKKMIIDKKDGIVFTTLNGERISPETLSSGEQHEIAMNFQLLFNTPKDSLVLIDEPEISLHFIWQQKFLTNIKEIAQRSNIDVLIATHSAVIAAPDSDAVIMLTGEKK